MNKAFYEWAMRGGHPRAVIEQKPRVDVPGARIPLLVGDFVRQLRPNRTGRVADIKSGQLGPIVTIKWPDGSESDFSSTEIQEDPEGLAEWVIVQKRLGAQR